MASATGHFMTDQAVVNKQKIAFRDPTTGLYLYFYVLKILVKTDCLLSKSFFFLEEIIIQVFFVDPIYI